MLYRKIELYILSLWLLFFLIIIITINIPISFAESSRFIGWQTLAKTNTTPICALFFLAVGAISYFRFKYSLHGSKSLSVQITEINDMNYEHLVFLTTYIIPLICFDLSSKRYVLALIILLTVIGAIYVRTDKFYANPTLALLGFKLYSIRLSGGEVLIMISRDNLTINDRIRFMHLDKSVCYGRKS